jgi:hypothetical protein
MGFSWSYHRGSDPTLPLPVRYLRFIECCSAFGAVTGLRLQRTHDELGHLFGFSRESKPDHEQISLALAAMVQVRFRLLYLLSEARLEKRRRKAAGDWRKQPPPFSQEDVLQLLRGMGRSVSR